MGITPFPDKPPRTDELVERPPEAGLFARIEGLVGEEDALLAIPRERRDGHQPERLRSIGAELDRVLQTLQRRAARRGHFAGS